MTTEEKDFLLKEYDTSWSHLRDMDQRRYQIFQYFTAFLGAVIIGLITLWTRENITPTDKMVGVLLTSILLLSMAMMARSVLKSERKATERYRNKINKIRAIFIFETADMGIKEYNELGKQISVEFGMVKPKKLRFFDFLFPEERCTALYIVNFLNLAIASSLFGIIWSVLYFVFC